MGRLASGKVGVISDTHGLLRASAIEALHGCDLIVHAGDVGDAKVLESLQASCARVIAVRGNVDMKWAHDLPDTADVVLGGRRIHVLHNVRDLAIDPVTDGFDIVISGHSHIPRIFTQDGVLYVNPGSAGPLRFRLPITIARLTLSPAAAEGRIVELAA